MALKKINQNPTITDTILLEIDTPDAGGCFGANPYKVDNLIIYYVERSFVGENYGEYDKKVVPDNLRIKLEKAQRELCDNPTQDNLIQVESVKSEIQSATQVNPIFFKERSAIKVVGNESYPAWLSTDVENSPLILQPQDNDGNSQFGRFTYEWNPQGSIREGDYFACWTWTPLPAGEKLSAHLHFIVAGDGMAVSTTPEHVTVPGKYENLLEKYLPEVYKFTLSNQDITPKVTEQLNLAVAKGFTFIEDMANQIIDLFDANALHESMLSYLSNLFALKLRSSDPTLWRRQIKESIPVFKKKGTIQGLKDAFFQSGMELNSFTQYWQLVSPYTWTESFKVIDSVVFNLEKNNIVLPLNVDNFKLYLKRNNTEEYQEISNNNVKFETNEDGIIQMIWIGDQLSVNKINLFQDDKIKVMYQYRDIPSEFEQDLENYIRLLPLMDQRNEDDQEYPPKNWNVKLISEDDPAFNTLIPVRHPFADPVQFGWNRTEFAYSENIYNSEEYNGSTRPSFDPCQIDKNFRDACSACMSSTYSADIGIQELSNDRLLEAQEILKEYVPFHAQIHSINFRGEVNEFVQSPVEHIETLINIDYVQYVLSGNKNPFFSRTMDGGLSNWIVTREQLTDQITVLSGKEGTAYNDQVSFISPDFILDNLGVIWDRHVLEVLSPSVNTGTYMIDRIQGSMARVTTPVVEPLDKSPFTFKLSNINYKTTVGSVFQDNLIILSDGSVDFDLEGMLTQWDIDHQDPPPSANPWYVKIPTYSTNSYVIKEIKNGMLVLEGDSYLPNVDTNNLNYQIFNGNDESVHSGTTGSLKVSKRGKVDLNDTSITNIFDIVKSGDLLFYDGNNYLISEIISDSEFYIDDYDSGDALGVYLEIRRKLIENGVGYFGYKGLHLTTNADHEAEFEIINGENHGPIDEYTDNNKFKENFLFKIGEEFYKIVSIDKENVVLEGREQDWGTLSYGGTTVDYSIVHFPKKQVNVGFIVFEQLGRNGYDPVIREIYSNIDQNTAIVALSTPKGSGVQENVAQEEGLSIEIEFKNGEKFEGEI